MLARLAPEDKRRVQGGCTDVRRPFPLLAFNAPACSAALSSSRPPGPSDFERDFREGFGATGSSLGVEAAFGWKAIDLRDRRGRGAGLPDMVSCRMVKQGCWELVGASSRRSLGDALVGFRCRGECSGVKIKSRCCLLILSRAATNCPKSHVPDMIDYA